jgi:nucleotide-binding universal stress UspA family protein
MSDQGPRSRIVVGVDSSDVSHAALSWAVEEASRRGALVEPIHVWHIPTSEATAAMGIDTHWENDAEQVLAHAVQRLAEHPGVVIQGRTMEGRPGEVLVAEAADPDTVLLVVGSRRRGRLARLMLGSTSQACVQHCPCPVVVVPGFESVEDEADPTKSQCLSA